MQSGARDSPEAQSPPGVVELREDVPLKAGAGFGAGGDEGCCAGGPRLILLAFAALSAAITLALLTQIYYGDYEVVPHGSVSSSAAACSSAGTDALKAGGRALDAAAAAALCLAVLAPHRTSLDASGSLLYWEYRQSRTQQPTLYEWGGPQPATVAPPPEPAANASAKPVTRPPRLLAALASLHARYGALPWARVLQPAIELARNGFNVSEGLATAEAAAGSAVSAKGTLRTEPQLAQFLETLQQNTSAELSAAWGGASMARAGTARAAAAGGWRAWSGGAGAGVALQAFAAALLPPPTDADDAERRVVNSLQQAATGTWPPAGVSSGLAAVDRLDTYVALVAGLSTPFGSGPVTAEGWTRDEPVAPLDLAPAIITDEDICGTRYVVGAESSGALAQGAAALAAAGGPEAVERARVEVRHGGALALQVGRPAPAPAALPPAPAPAPALNATPPFAAVNVVRQSADALLSYADSRGGGYASRF
ncbi:hypothetical protein ABMA27_013654 [Loxostege sticticalis]|uniref:Uncharacterized protein n=1 Tax=Loxostege sticticalis TaxID=481309 RepID=A0ABR3IG16_LOXSC